MTADHPLAAELFAAAALPRMKPVVFFGRDLFVRVMSGKEREAYEATRRDGKDEAERLLRARVVVLTLCDAGGVRIFRDDQVEVAAGFDWDELDRVFNAARDLNSVSAEARAEERKNS